MANINTTFDQIIRPFEGLYSNLKNDSGGETVWGYARNKNPMAPLWAFVDGAKKFPNFPENMRYDSAITNLVISLYKINYWDKLRLDDVKEQRIANELFDIAVNCGVTSAANYLQRALNVLNRNGKDYADLTVDNFVGPKTIAVLNNHLRPDKVIKSLNILQGAHYITLAEENKIYENFENGWLESSHIKSNHFMFNNYFKPTPKKVKVFLLAFKGFIGTISVASFFDGSKNAAFVFLVIGATVDLLLQCTTDKSDTITQNP